MNHAIETIIFAAATHTIALSSAAVLMPLNARTAGQEIA